MAHGEKEEVTRSQAKKLIKRLFHPWQTIEYLLLRRALQDYARVVEENDRLKQAHARQLEQLYLEFQVRLLKLMVIGK